MEPVKESEIRLLQFRPAWSREAALRFRNLTHSVENLSTNICINKSAPVLIVDNTVYTERDGLNKIMECSNVVCARQQRIFADFIEQSLISPFKQLRRITKDEEREVAQGSSLFMGMLNSSL